MNILHLSTLSLCGVATYTANLKAELAALGINGDIAPIDRAQLATFSKAQIMAYYDQVCHQAQEYDLIHLQHDFSFYGASHGVAFANEVVARMLKRLAKQPVVITFHATPGILYRPEFGALPRVITKRIGWGLKRYLKEPVQQFWRQQIAPQFQPGRLRLAVVHNQFSRQDFIELGSHPDCVATVNIGIEHLPPPQPASEAVAQAVQALNIQPGDRVLGAFGFLSAGKGHLSILEAMAFLPPNYKLLLVGDLYPGGADSAFSRQFFQRLYESKLNDRVYITGYFEYADLRHYSDLMDLVIVAHQPPCTGSSASINIALTQGQAIVATDIPSFREINAQHDCLELVTPASAGEMAYRIEHLFTRPHRLAQLRHNAAQYARDNRWDTIAQHYLKHYEALTQ